MKSEQSEDKMRYPDDLPRSRALYERARASLPGGNTRTTVFLSPFPIYADRGAGCRIWDVDGVARIDCVNNYTAAIHGHAHPVLRRAAERQLELGTAFGLPTESEIELAELLARRVPSVEHTRFTNSGTEAVMQALKAARAFTGRPKIAKCEGAYHGTYDYAEISLEPGPAEWGERDPRPVPTARGTPSSVAADVVVLPFNDTDAAARILRSHRGELAAVIVDPLPGHIGFVPADRGYVAALRELCDEAGALLIFDEVISFRLGYHGAQALWGVRPDLTTFGKIIGGGFAVGAVGGRADVMAVFDPSAGPPALPHGGTFSANPITMRCGLAAMQLLDNAAFAQLAAHGDRMRNGIDAALQRHGIEGRTAGMGSLLKVHLGTGPLRDYRSVRPDRAASARLRTLMIELLNDGVLIAGNGLIALSTPMTSADIDAVLTAFDRALGRLAR
jgi:glutamate-1-semialdehyde 2,1-aminomutase